jgi:hypothetical protein
LQSNTEQWKLHFALNSAALHFCWFTAHLHEEQFSIGVVAATQGCCEPVLKISPELWGMQFAKTSVAVH